MAKTDELMKKLFKHKEIFADLFNATLFNGKQIIKAEKLAELNTENIHVDESISSNVIHQFLNAIVIFACVKMTVSYKSY